MQIDISEKRWEELRSLINEIDGPHEHRDGMNECSICDEPLIDAAIRLLSSAPSASAVSNEIVAERGRQDMKWGGPAHDDLHSTAEFIQWIVDYAGWARMMDSMKSLDKARRRLIQVAALAMAAVESMDRKSR